MVYLHPLENFANISYLVENLKPDLLRDFCTLCSGALVSDSLLHMLPYQIWKIEKEEFELQKECIKLSNYLYYTYNLHADYLSYT